MKEEKQKTIAGIGDIPFDDYAKMMQYFDLGQIDFITRFNPLVMKILGTQKSRIKHSIISVIPHLAGSYFIYSAFYKGYLSLLFCVPLIYIGQSLSWFSCLPKGFSKIEKFGRFFTLYIPVVALSYFWYHGDTLFTVLSLSYLLGYNCGSMLRINCRALLLKCIPYSEGLFVSLYDYGLIRLDQLYLFPQPAVTPQDSSEEPH